MVYTGTELMRGGYRHCDPLSPAYTDYSAVTLLRSENILIVDSFVLAVNKKQLLASGYPRSKGSEVMVENNNRKVEQKSAICLLALVCCIMLQAEIFWCKPPLIKFINLIDVSCLGIDFANIIPLIINSHQ